MTGNLCEKITIGLSPCPNDTFIFHALLHGLVKIDSWHNFQIEPHMADVEKLNRLALEAKLPFSKVSTGVLPHILDRYFVLSSGGALGWGCGPLVVARRPLDANEIKKARVAIPGKMTTANLLLNLHGGFSGKRIEMLFSDVMDAVEKGEADAGVIIHEGRFTYHERKLVKILDLGEWWESVYKLPLPLGAIVARRDLPVKLVREVQEAIGQSLRYAWKRPEDSKAFIRDNAREISEAVTSAHIRTFVTRYSEDLGKEGRESIRMLVGTADVNRGAREKKEMFID